MRSTTVIVLMLVLLATLSSCGDKGTKSSIPVVRLVYPAPGQIVDNGCDDGMDPIEFRYVWNSIQGAERYHLYCIGPGALYPITDRTDFTDTVFAGSGTGAYVANPNCVGWTWMVRAKVAGEWSAWSEVRTYDYEPLNTDCP